MGVTLRHFLVLGLLAFVVTYLCVPLARRLALRLDAVDYPSARRVNKRPTPRMGGIAMAAGIAAALIVEVAGEYFFGWAGFYIHGTDRAINHAGVMCGLLTIVCVGAMDDVYSLKPSVKFAGQILGATIIAASGLLLSSIAKPSGRRVHPVRLVVLSADGAVPRVLHERHQPHRWSGRPGGGHRGHRVVLPVLDRLRARFGRDGDAVHHFAGCDAGVSALQLRAGEHLHGGFGLAASGRHDRRHLAHGRHALARRSSCWRCRS